jgi:hypothetical protein
MKVLRGYRKKYTHELSGVIARNNLAKIANGRSGFKGFRSKRIFEASGNLYGHPNQGMSRWGGA